MTRKPIINKTQMYALLHGGALGNTVPMWFDLQAWEASDEYHRFDLWGVRTLTTAGPCRLFCPRGEVRETATRPEYAAAGVNVSLMIDAVCDVTLMADVFDSERGLIVYGIDRPAKGTSWRKAMPVQGRQYEGLAARMLLQERLDAGSLADLYELLEVYPRHVVEISACDRFVGTVPRRNTIVWECRLY